jgi:hypothetical protein
LEAPVKAFHGYLVTSEEQVGTRQEWCLHIHVVQHGGVLKSGPHLPALQQHP